MPFAALQHRVNIKRKPDQYELRMDFENELYSVANVNRPSMKLDFLSDRFLIEDDTRAGSKELSDLLTLTRASVGTYRNASGTLSQASIDESRMHYPAPRIVSVESDDMSSYADVTAYQAAGGTLEATYMTFDAANDKVDIANTAGHQIVSHSPHIAVPAGAVVRVGAEIAGFSSSVGSLGIQVRDEGNWARGAEITSDGIAWSLPYIAPDGDVRGKLVIDDTVSCQITRWVVQVLSHLDGDSVGLLVERVGENLYRESELGNYTPYRGIGGVEWLKSGTTNLAIQDPMTYNAGVTIGVSIFCQFRGQVPDDSCIIYHKIGSSYIGIRLHQTGEVTLNANYSSSPAISNATIDFIEDWGGGLFRVAIYFTADEAASGLNSVLQVIFSSDGDGTWGLWLGGLQWEVGKTSSYIPTPSGTTAIRNTDNGTIDLTTQLLNIGKNSFTIVLDMQQIVDFPTDPVYQLSLFTANNDQSLLLFSGNNVYRNNLDESSDTTDISGLNWNDKNRHRVAICWKKDGSLSLSYDGNVTQSSPNSRMLPGILNSLRLGGPHDGAPSTNIFRNNALFYGIRLIPSDLTDIELQEESTL